MTRFCSFAFVAIAWLGLSGCGLGPSRDTRVFRIGYQKWSTFSILKVSGRLSAALAARNTRIEWIEFPAGPPLLEALNAGSLDIGHTGDSPPLFAQAAGIPLIYFGVSSASPESSGILLPASSNIRRASDLVGRRLGFAKGTSAHTLVLRYLEKHGIPLGSITPVYLAPADGLAALETGAIDAWSIWDPYLASAEHTGRFKKLTGGDGYVEGREFYLASRAFATENPGQLREFLRELEDVKSWAKDRSGEVNRFLAAETGIPVEAVALAEARRNRYLPESLTPALVASQQSLADRYFELGILPRKIQVHEAVFNLAGKT